MQQYRDMLEHVLANGVDKGDRTGTGTRSVFGHQMRFNLQEGFPLVTGKFTPFRLIAVELLWFLRGNPDIKFLHENDCHIWDEWVKSDGTFGPIYGQQWRSWPDYRQTPMYDYTAYSAMEAKGYKWHGQDPVTAFDIWRRDIDQLANVINALKTRPDDRRMIVSAWNVADVESGEMALPPCHAMFQFYSAPMNELRRYRWVQMNGVEPNADWSNVPTRKLSCQLYQRSADTFLGVPFNIASYSLLTHMVAQVTGHAVGEFIWTGGDVHVYRDHLDQVSEYLSREPYPLPTLWLNPSVTDIDSFTIEDMRVLNYKHHPKIAAKVSV